MAVDYSIHLGNVLTILGAAVGFLILVITMRNQVDALKSDVAELKGEVKEVAKMLVTMARYDERLTAMASMQASSDQRNNDSIRRLWRDFDLLRHRKGFIIDDPDPAIPV